MGLPYTAQLLPRLRGQQLLPGFKAADPQGGSVPPEDILCSQSAALWTAMGTGGAKVIAALAQRKGLSPFQGGQDGLHPGCKGLVVAMALKQRGAEQMVAPKSNHDRVTSRALCKLKSRAFATP